MQDLQHEGLGYSNHHVELHSTLQIPQTNVSDEVCHSFQLLLTSWLVKGYFTSCVIDLTFCTRQSNIIGGKKYKNPLFRHDGFNILTTGYKQT